MVSRYLRTPLTASAFRGYFLSVQCASACFGRGAFAGGLYNTGRERSRRPLVPHMEPASDPWTCSICTYQHDELAELGNDRCSMCEAPRHKRDRVSASLVSQRDSDASDDADSVDSFGFTHICSRETDVCGDLQVALAAFGENSVEVHPCGPSLLFLDLFIEPSELVPSEVCKAWGLKQLLQVRLCFEGGSRAYTAGVLHSVKVLHPNRVLSAPPLDAAADGCIVAHQLARVVEAFWMPDRDESGTSLSHKDAAAAGSSDGRTEAMDAPNSTKSWQVAVGAAHCEDGRVHSHALAKRYRGGIAQTVAYLRSRIRSFNEYCAICDKPHVFGTMLQPTVCTRPLCSHQFSAFGASIVGAASLAMHAEVLDLLIATTTLAASSPRAEHILTPFPSVHSSDSSHLALDPMCPDCQLALEVLRAFPAFEAINSAALDDGSSGLKQAMDARHELGFPMFEWILSSNRAHLVSVPPALQLARLGTRHQFVMLSAPPERQARFDELKAEHGSAFAWHGSAPENWHAILRTGLRNASGTNLQVNGAAYGAGIYLSTDGTFSMAYSTRRQSSPPVAQANARSSNAFLGGKALNILALCEVVKTPTLRQVAGGGTIWVAPDEDSVVTRFLFAFPNGVPNMGNLSSVGTSFEQEVRTCLQNLDRMSCQGSV